MTPMQENFPSTKQTKCFGNQITNCICEVASRGESERGESETDELRSVSKQMKTAQVSFFIGTDSHQDKPNHILPPPSLPLSSSLMSLTLEENVLVCTSFKSSTIAIYSFLWSTALIFISAIFLLFGRLPFLVGISFYLVYPHMATPGPCVR